MARPRLRALLLAAGRGERLRPLTFEIPKPLLPIAGRPLATFSLDRLVRAGCDAVALNLHHLGETVRRTLGESYGALPIVYSSEPELLGTGGALPPLAAFLGAAERVLVVNGDSLCRWPLRELLARHRASGAAATLLIHAHVEPRGFGGGVAVERGRVVAFRRGTLAWEAARCRRVFAGAAVLEPHLLERLPAGPSDIVSALYEPMLAASEPIAAFETARRWFDLGTPERYLEGALAWGLADRPAGGARCGDDACEDATARLRRSVVEPGGRVGRGARLDETLVLAGASVGAGARLRRVVVGPGVKVAAEETLDGLLLTRDPEPPHARVATPLVRAGGRPQNPPSREA